MVLNLDIHKYEFIQPELWGREKKLPKLMLVICWSMLVTNPPVARHLNHQLPPVDL